MLNRIYTYYFKNGRAKKKKRKERREKRSIFKKNIVHVWFPHGISLFSVIFSLIFIHQHVIQ